MRRSVSFILAVLVGGCVNQLAQRQAFLNPFVGRPDSELVRQLGVPNRSYETGGVKYLAYDESRVTFVPALPPYGLGPWWAYGGYGGGFPPQVVTLTCETTFAVAGGVVKSYTLRGNACG
ncbi:MAG TPA: hypothetical protein VND19_04785 [Acetobacteraceae bacterium]|nr:hypothetical protein [Acetobacteraceae bacterium]